MGATVLYAVTAACGFGVALVLTKLGLQYITARAGAAVSIPSATVLFWCAAPFALDPSGWNAAAIAIFAVVGVFFPAAVTLLMFEANDQMGPTVAGTISSTTPLFAVCGAILFLDEALTPLIALGALAVVLGIAVLAWRPTAIPVQWPRAAIGLPLLAAAIRGLSQALIKVGLTLWPNPFAAALTGYSISAITVVAARSVGARSASPASHLKGAGWFALAGLCNGAAVLIMYHALKSGPVAVVSTIVAAHPFVALAIGACVLRIEKLDAAQAFGVLLAVAGVILVIVG